MTAWKQRHSLNLWMEWVAGQALVEVFLGFLGLVEEFWIAGEFFYEEASSFLEFHWSYMERALEESAAEGGHLCVWSSVSVCLGLQGGLPSR